MTSVSCLTVMGTLTLIAPRERLRDRIAVRLQPRRLDIELANGTPAEGSATLALRARRLAQLSRRRQLASAIRRLVRKAADGGSSSYVGVSPLWGRVAAASDELTGLATRLAQPEPVAPRGVAQTLLLLTDGCGPLYNRRSRASVAERAAIAAETLGSVA